MKTVLKTAPVKMPVTLKEAKEHLNITLGWTDDDAYIDSLITMAVERVEQITRSRLISQTWYYYPSDWPTDDKMPIPYGNLQSVTAIKYTNSSEVEATFSAADYYLADTNSNPGKVVLRYSENWPTVTLSPSDPIEVEFICGYGDDEEDVPATIKHAMKFLISNAYENRETLIIGQGFSIASINTVENWLTPYKIHGVF